MALNWPATVPFKPIDPYEREETLPIEEEENDLGIPNRLRTGSIPIIRHSFSLRFTHEEFDVLREWVLGKLNCGILSFYFPEPYAEKIKTGRFVLNNKSWYSDFDINNFRIQIRVVVEETNE